MPNRVRVVTVPDADRAELEQRARDRAAPARVVERARIVLLAAEGLTGPQIAERAGCTEPTVVKWRRRYAETGLAGLEDARRPGGPARVLTAEAVREILAATVAPPPGSLQAQRVTHWSSRRLADWLDRSQKINVSHDSISRLWRRFCLQPRGAGGFAFATDPPLEAEAHEVVGLYLHPPETAVVVERPQPVLPMGPGIPGRQARDGIRHAATSLLAALSTAAGQITDARHPGHQGFLAFLTRTAATCPGAGLHVICGNAATHQPAEVGAWLARPENQRITLHVAPTGCSWITLVECFFSVSTRQAAGHCPVTSVKDLVVAITAFTDTWHDMARPFTWIRNTTGPRLHPSLED